MEDIWHVTLPCTTDESHAHVQDVHAIDFWGVNYSEMTV